MRGGRRRGEGLEEKWEEEDDAMRAQDEITVDIAASCDNTKRPTTSHHEKNPHAARHWSTHTAEKAHPPINMLAYIINRICNDCMTHASHTTLYHRHKG